MAEAWRSEHTSIQYKDHESVYLYSTVHYTIILQGTKLKVKVKVKFTL
jgi:hypothetical protein